MNRWQIAGIVAIGATGIVAACGSSLDSTFHDPSLDDAGGGTGSSSFGGDPNADSASAPIDIDPPNPVLSATGTAVTQQFHAYLHGTTTEVPVTWTLDIGTLGPIGAATGLFTGNGVVGGVAQVTATHGTAIATTSVTVNVALVDGNGISPADQTLLTTGGPLTNDPAMKWLYPYDQTVFPRGLRSPLLQFAGTAPDATLVRFKSQHFQYDAFFPASNPGRVTLSEARWTTITQSASGSDTIKVSITKKSGAVVTGPVDETWTIAPASLAGTVYYNTYNSPQANGQGALYKVRPGSTVDAQLLVGNCTVCHSVSANGTVITTGVQWGNGDPLQSGILSIDAAGNASTTHVQSFGQYAFGALTPDAKYEMTHSNNHGGLRGLTNASGQYSTLIDPKTGAAVPGVKGWPANMEARMPSFSPDGKFIAYNDGNALPGNAPDLGQVLGAMAFDAATLTFTPLGTLWTDTKKVSWPAFLPDSKSIVFHAGEDFGTQSPFHADIEIVDVVGKTRSYMPALNGFAGTDTTYGATYLPYGEANEGHLNYEPTVLPVASGGFYWVVFTSRRAYGNELTNTQDPWGRDSLNPTELSPRKKLWVAAIDLNPTPGKDRSHPAFYLPGQQLDTGNMRAFWALDPCHPNGESCDTGDQCCGGYCQNVTEPDGAMGFVCSDKPQGCAQVQDKCNVAADCCGASGGVQCINGHCAAPTPK